MRNDSATISKLRFIGFIKDLTKENMSIQSFLDFMFISWFYPLSGIPSKFHQSKNANKKSWTQAQIGLLRAFIWDNGDSSMRLQSYVINESEEQQLFSENCRLYGVLFFEAFLHLSLNDQREVLNDLLVELIRVNQFTLLRHLLRCHHNLVSIYVFLNALEATYGQYSEAVLPEKQLKRMGDLLGILPSIHIAFGVSDQLENYSMHEMRAEIFPVILVRDEDDQEMVRERLSKIITLIIAIGNPIVDSFFSGAHQFLLRQLELQTCIAWLLASPENKNQRKREIIHHIIINELNKSVSVPAVLERAYSSFLLSQAAINHAPDQFLLHIFDQGTDWFIENGKTVLANKSIRKMLMSLGWAFDNKITPCAPLSFEALNAYRFNKPEAVEERGSHLCEGIARLQALIDSEDEFLAKSEAKQALLPERGVGTLFWHSQQAVKRYCEKKAVLEESLLNLTH